MDVPNLTYEGSEVSSKVAGENDDKVYLAKFNDDSVDDPLPIGTHQKKRKSKRQVKQIQKNDIMHKKPKMSVPAVKKKGGWWLLKDLDRLKELVDAREDISKIYEAFPSRSSKSIRKQMENILFMYTQKNENGRPPKSVEKSGEGDVHGVPFSPGPASGSTIGELLEIPTMDVGHRTVLTADEKRTILEAPIVRIKKLVNPLNEAFWDFHAIEEKYGHQIVDVLRQNSHEEGFRLNTHFNERQPLQKFLKYFQSHHKKSKTFMRTFAKRGRKCIGTRDGQIYAGQHEVTGKHTPMGASVKYCVNVDMRAWTEYIEMLKSHLPSFLHCQGEEDILRFVHQDIDGMTSPQMYFKVPGVWTGGHEENLRFRSINCSHGHGESQWFAIAPEHANKFREIVQKVENVDIYQQEGCYFPSVKFLRSHGIPVMTCYQEPGDVIVLQGGTQHWVRAKGYAVNSSWNFGHGTLRQFEASYARYEINKFTNVRNIVPLKILTLDYIEDVLITKKGTFDHEPGLRKYLANRVADILAHEVQRREDIFEVFTEHNIVSEPADALVVLCEEHKSCTNCELVSVYVRCLTCEKLNIKRQKYRKKKYTPMMSPVYRCVDCAITHHQHLRSHECILQEKKLGSLERLLQLYAHPYFKHERSFETSLVERCQRVLKREKDRHHVSDANDGSKTVEAQCKESKNRIQPITVRDSKQTEDDAGALEETVEVAGAKLTTNSASNSDKQENVCVTSNVARTGDDTQLKHSETAKKGPPTNTAQEDVDNELPGNRSGDTIVRSGSNFTNSEFDLEEVVA